MNYMSLQMYYININYHSLPYIHCITNHINLTNIIATSKETSYMSLLKLHGVETKIIDLCHSFLYERALHHDVIFLQEGFPGISFGYEDIIQLYIVKE